MTMKPQLELSLQQTPCSRPAARRQRRLQRAHWWFTQMRQVVDRALDHNLAHPTQPEQIHLGLGRATQS